MAKKKTDDTYRTAYHEAGHAVLGHHLGLTVRWVGLTPDCGPGQYGMARMANHDPDPRTVEDRGRRELIVRKHLLLTLAGPAAEEMATDTPYSVGDTDADDMFPWLWLVVDDPDDADDYTDALDLACRFLLAALWPEVEIVAREILERGSLTGEEFAAAVKAAGTPGPAIADRLVEPRGD